MTTGKKVAIGALTVVGLYGVYRFFFKKNVPNSQTAVPPPGGSTNTAGQILNASNGVIGLVKALVTPAGVTPAAASGGNAAAGAGPVPASVQWNGQSVYANGTSINASNQYVDSTGTILGYLSVDGNIYDNNGNLIGSSDAGSDGNPAPTPTAQVIYTDNTYVDVNGYYHAATGGLLGFLGTDGYLYDLNGNPLTAEQIGG